jgi:hypothetical protein
MKWRLDGLELVHCRFSIIRRKPVVSRDIKFHAVGGLEWFFLSGLPASYRVPRRVDFDRRLMHLAWITASFHCFQDVLLSQLLLIEAMANVSTIKVASAIQNDTHRPNCHHNLSKSGSSQFRSMAGT